jgi:hypothetical protein
MENGDCHVIPVGSNKTAGEKLKKFVQDYHNQEIDVHLGTTYRVNILPGAIEDTSFLPPEAHSKCNKYYWLSVIGEGRCKI